MLQIKIKRMYLHKIKYILKERKILLEKYHNQNNIENLIQRNLEVLFHFIMANIEQFS